MIQNFNLDNQVDSGEDNVIKLMTKGPLRDEVDLFNQ